MLVLVLGLHWCLDSIGPCWPRAGQARSSSVPSARLRGPGVPRTPCPRRVPCAGPLAAHPGPAQRGIEAGAGEARWSSGRGVSGQLGRVASGRHVPGVSAACPLCCAFCVLHPCGEQVLSRAAALSRCCWLINYLSAILGNCCFL